MRISIEKYASSLYQSLLGLDQEEAKKRISKFVAILGRNGDLNKTKELIASFEKTWNEAEGEISAELSSARPLNSESKGLIADYLKLKTKAQKISIHEQVEPSLLGGFILKYNSRILDGSLKNSLNNLKNKFSN